MVFNRLIIANIRQNSFKEINLTVGVNWNQDATLKHYLQQSNGFERDTFTSSIRARDYDYPFVKNQFYALRICFSISFIVGNQQKRVIGIYKRNSLFRT